MRAGLLRRPVIVQRATRSRDTRSGESVRVWEPIASRRAEIRELTARERVNADQPLGDSTHRITLHAGDGLEVMPDDRIVDQVDGLIYQPAGRQLLGGPRRYIQVLARVSDRVAGDEQVEEFGDTFDESSGWNENDFLVPTADDTPWNMVQQYGDVGAPLLVFNNLTFTIRDVGGLKLVMDSRAEPNPTGDDALVTAVVKESEYQIGTDYDVTVRYAGPKVTDGGPYDGGGFTDGDDIDFLVSQHSWGAPFIRGSADFKSLMWMTLNQTPWLGGSPNPNQQVNLWDRTNAVQGTVRQTENTLVPMATAFPPADFPAAWLELMIRVRGNQLTYRTKLSTQTDFHDLYTFTDAFGAGNERIGIYRDGDGGAQPAAPSQVISAFRGGFLL